MYSSNLVLPFIFKNDVSNTDRPADCFAPSVTGLQKFNFNLALGHTGRWRRTGDAEIQWLKLCSCGGRFMGLRNKDYCGEQRTVELVNKAHWILIKLPYLWVSEA